MKNKFVEVKNIDKSFVGVQALKDVDLTINRGEVRTLVGENGSGKTTLIKVIAGVYERDKGEIVIDGEKFDHLRPIEAIKKGIQIIYQDFSLFPNMTVAENIALSSELAEGKHIINWNNIRELARKALAKINLDIDIDKRVSELSVADKQLVAISRALLYDAQLIIMDEPTTTLTRKEVQTLFDVIRDLKSRNISILFVSHKLNEVMEISEKVTILRDGKKVFDGPVKDLNQEKIEHYMTGENLSKFKDFTFEKNEPKEIMRVENLSKKNKFKDISFTLNSGEILGITGLLGSGRTDLALSLFGLEPADSGKIYIKGEEKNLDSPQTAIDNGIGYVPEDRLKEGLVLDKPIGDNIITGILDDLSEEFNLINFQKANQRIDHWINRLSIKASSAWAPVHSLSGGNQQRVVLAKWLATNPRIFILNGPTVGVDVGSKVTIHKFLREFVQEEERGVILISDDIPEITSNCNRILLLKEGEIKEEILSDEITDNELYEKLIAEK